MTATEWANSQFTGEVTGASVVNGRVVVNFRVTNGYGEGVAGLGSTSTSGTTGLTTLANLSFALGKMVPADPMATDPVKGPSRWVSYIVTTAATPGNPNASPPTTATASAPSKPSTENNGTLVDNGDGSYIYTFDRRIDGTGSVQEVLDSYTKYTTSQNKADLDDVRYAPNLTHRIGIHISGAFRGTGTNTPNGVQTQPAVNLKTPGNVFYDFVPATGTAVAMTETDPMKQRNVVDVRNCLTCHTKFTFHGGLPLKGTGGSRQDTRMCVLCHTDQRKYGVTNVTSTATSVGTGATSQDRIDGISIKNLPVWIHKIHMGEELIKTGYNANNILLNEIRFPQDVRNCTKCHSDTTGKTAATGSTVAQADHWKTKPSRLACGACHDGIDFSKGTGIRLADRDADVAAGVAIGTTQSGHGGGAPQDDSTCVTCHRPGLGTLTDVEIAHTPVSGPKKGWTLMGFNGSGSVAGFNASRLPAGAAKITYSLTSVTLNASKQPVFKFKFLNGTTPVVFNAAPAARPTAAEIQAANVVELMPNFRGGPNAFIMAAVPQDGIAAPADWNVVSNVYIRNCWNQMLAATVCTMTGPDAAGDYILTMTGVTVPTNATMVTGAIGFNYGANMINLPLTQTNVAGYPLQLESGAIPANLYAAASYPEASTLSGQNGVIGFSGGLQIPATPVTKVVSSDAAGKTLLYAARRAIVEKARCDNCHNSLGVFARAGFHVGQRNDPAMCALCHDANRTNNGWSVSSNAFVHAIHGGAKRQADGAPNFTWGSLDTTVPPDGVPDTGFYQIGYPGVLRDCQQCHLPNTVNFGGVGTACTNAASSITNACNSFAVNNMAFRTVAGATVTATHTKSPYVAAGSYGAGFAASTTWTGGAATQAAGTTLVNSPITNACFSCHTTNAAQAHMTGEGGVLYTSRDMVAGGVGAYAGTLVNKERCVVCHGAGRVADVEVVHGSTMK